MATVITLGLLMTLAVIVVHYFSLRGISKLALQMSSEHVKNLFTVSLIFALHCVEIVWYALHVYVLHGWLGISGFSDPFEGSIANYLHVAATSFTTLGSFGNQPTNNLALTSDFISLTGFTMLTWSATFYYNIFSRVER